MPFVSVYRPSIQIGLLKAIGATSGFSVSGYHFNLHFAHLIGVQLFEDLCEVRERRDGEWLFSAEAFGSTQPDLEDVYPDHFAAGIGTLPRAGPETPGTLRKLRRVVVPAFLDYLVQSVDWARFRVVGFTSTFQQNAASFALARRLKSLHPHIITLFGGANFEAEMGIELVRSVDVIDYAIIGEADEAFPEFLAAIEESRDPATIPGVVRRNLHGVTVPVRRAPFLGLANSPVPDYSDYFSDAARLGLIDASSPQTVAVPFESSRGCWWGQKKHCVFCGLNGGTMQFRAKPAEKVIEQLTELARRHGTFEFFAVDNILSTDYFEHLLDRLASEGHDFRLFYEVKSNLTRDRIRRMKRGGVRHVQPGIESLNSHVLELMRKGVSAIQNVNTLRWCRYYGISVAWNLLWGFPGEVERDYEEQAQLVPLLRHLQAPDGFGPIWMERFSPVFSDPVAFPRTFVRPENSYRFVYPANVDLEKVAYFFEYEFKDRLSEAVYLPLSGLLEAWKDAWAREEKPTLFLKSTRDFARIEDRRFGDLKIFNLEGLGARLYAACSDGPKSAQQLATELAPAVSTATVSEILDGFVANGLAMRDRLAYLSLAVPWYPGR
jgi:ribosomal peptide maturation radical SAM protein 1